MPHTAEVVVMRLTTEKVLKEQFDFLLELDRLKSVVRQSSLADGSRRENSAEHSWHLAMFALVLSEYADVEVNAARAANLLLVHDIVEIDAGDAPIHASGVSKTETRSRRAQGGRAHFWVASGRASRATSRYVA
jgi:putative hydrolases of HD superfamily